MRVLAVNQSFYFSHRQISDLTVLFSKFKPQIRSFGSFRADWKLSLFNPALHLAEPLWVITRLQEAIKLYFWVMVGYFKQVRFRINKVDKLLFIKSGGNTVEKFHLSDE